MEIIDYSKSVLENIYFLSGPILAIFGCLILYQIKLAKKSVELAEQQVLEAKKYLMTISKRDAAVIATKQIDFYIEKIIPFGDELFERMEEIKFPKFKGKIKDFTLGEIAEWDKTYIISFSNKLTDLGYKDIRYINYLEGFATYFTKGIADEEIAFSSIGSTFIGTVETYYPFISAYRNNKRNYNNLVELYRIWKNRLEKSELELELEKKHVKQNEELKHFEEILEKVNKEIKTIKPLGTE